jgi:hypothetical protein
MCRMDKYRRQNPELINSTDQLPPHLMCAIIPTSKEHVGNTECDIGTTIRYLDIDRGKIMECTIQDYGTSELRGDWVEVVYDDEREMRISQGEMDEILANRISSLS